jgi:hypothetical protein
MTASAFLSGHELTYPNPDEIELTFFGPGFGESIVVHVPGIGWGIIDSCEFKTKNEKFIPPLEYLFLQNINHISFLILTHPHLDHFSGMDEIIQNYLGKIDRVCLYAGDGVREYASYLINKRIMGFPGATQLAVILKELKNATKKGADRRKLGALTSIIPRQGVSVNGKSFEVEIISLSPLAEDEERYVDILRKALPKLGEKFKNLPDRDHNLIASAIRISVGETIIILGSDVEKGRTALSGWRGIVESLDAPDLSVKVLKVAHHGSTNAYHKKAWEEHSKKSKIVSVIMPYHRGGQILPTIKDIQRIGKHSSFIGLTSTIAYSRPLDFYDRAVVRRLPESWKVLKYPEQCGMITLRYDIDGNMKFRQVVQPATLTCLNLH